KTGRAAERSNLRRSGISLRRNSPPADHHATRHTHREGAGHCQVDQEFKEKSAGLDPGRFGAGERYRSRHTPGSDRYAAPAGFRNRHAIHELLHKLITYPRGTKTMTVS